MQTKTSLKNMTAEERKAALEPYRINQALTALHELGFTTSMPNYGKIEFEYKGAIVSFWPYSGWHSGESIVSGRGLKSLLDQLKSN